MAASDGWVFFFLSSFLNLPWLVGLRHRIPARAREGICSSSVLQAQNKILFMEFNPLCWLAALERLARKWWGERYWRKRQVELGRGGPGMTSLCPPCPPAPPCPRAALCLCVFGLHCSVLDPGVEEAHTEVLMGRGSCVALCAGWRRVPVVW